MGLESKSVIPEDRVYFQDPAFLDIDAEFLNSLGYTVIFDPEALDVTLTTTFYFGIYIYKFLPETLSSKKCQG